MSPRRKSAYITHLLCFALGCSLTLLFLSYDVARRAGEAFDLTSKEDYSLVIVVLSAPDNAHKRDAVRDSWAHRATAGMQYLFAIGGQDVTLDQRLQIIQEQKLHGDILILPVKDSYANLTLKVLESFKHLYASYNFKFVFKCDDDTFVNIPVLEGALAKKSASRLYWGYFSGTAKVFTRGKWKENDWFLCDRYLPYALGGGYVLSYDLVEYIVRNYHIFSVYRSEDVSIGTWLSPLNITRHHDIRFDTGHKSRGCHNNFIALHRKLAGEMRALGLKLTEGKDLCEVEHDLIPSYNYNWTVLPSQCCTVA